MSMQLLKIDVVPTHLKIRLIRDVLTLIIIVVDTLKIVGDVLIPIETDVLTLTLIPILQNVGVAFNLQPLDLFVLLVLDQPFDPQFHVVANKLDIRLKSHRLFVLLQEGRFVLDLGFLPLHIAVWIKHLIATQWALFQTFFLLVLKVRGPCRSQGIRRHVMITILRGRVIFELRMYYNTSTLQWV